ncbi:MAG TPA: ATP-dependent Clp protease ATP-binding subunit [Candidatus Bathyarchaeia archaeon]|nr:ATP-dependent Clp protease ATP-binding subunit [Candidatus Bathyarchaeia archaeon]
MKIISAYFSWHYVFAPRKLLKIAGNFLTFFYHYFSAGLLVRTFFTPWKRQNIKRERRLTLTNLLHVFSFNLISRSLGAVVRGIVLIGWALAEITTLGFFVILIPSWIIIPGFTYPLYLLLRTPPDPAEKLTGKNIVKPQEIFNFLAETEMGKFLFSRIGSPEKMVDSLKKSLSKDQPFPLPAKSPSSARLFYLLAKNWEPFKKFLFDQKLDEEDVLTVCRWFKRIKKQKRQKVRFWELENLLSRGGIGKDWAYGYTLDLDRYSDDLTQPLPFSHHLVGRKRETELIQQVLSRAEENNVLLVGQPGVGRHTIILEFAKKVKEGRINPSLAHKRVLSLNLNLLLGASESTIIAKGKIEEILKEAASAGNTILIINNLDKFVSSGPGRTDLSDLFKKTSTGGRLQIIGITTPAAFQKYIFPNQEITKVFEKVEVSPPTLREALIILQNTTPFYEKRNRVFVLHQSLSEIIKKSDQYVTDIPFPEKAIDLLDETCVYVATKLKKVVVAPDDLNQVLEEKIKIPLGDIEKAEKEKLENLESLLHQRIVNQETAVNQIAKAMRRSRIGIAQKDKPIGTFLFLGPTGVGKTETAKALAEAYFGDEKRMIRFDMSEYQGDDAIKRVLGFQEKDEPGLIASAIRKNPFSLLLLDEIEKAYPDVLNLFLVMLDEGFFTDAFGKKIDCRNLIIIGTSNAGSEFIREQLKKDPDDGKLPDKVLDFVQKKEIFSPELLNRFDAVVVYQPLNNEHLRLVARLLLKRLDKRLAEKDLSLKITDQLIEKIVELGYNPALGARPMKRVIQDKIEDQIAKRILKGELKRGQLVEVDL